MIHGDGALVAHSSVRVLLGFRAFRFNKIVFYTILKKTQLYQFNFIGFVAPLIFLYLSGSGICS